MILESRAVKPVDFRVDFAHLFLCLAGNTNFVTRLSYFRPRKLEEPVKRTQNNDTVSIDLTMCFLIQGRLGLWGIYRTSSQSLTLTVNDRIWKHCKNQARRLLSKICVQFDARKKNNQAVFSHELSSLDSQNRSSKY